MSSFLPSQRKTFFFFFFSSGHQAQGTLCVCYGGADPPSHPYHFYLTMLFFLVLLDFSILWHLLIHILVILIELREQARLLILKFNCVSKFAVLMITTVWACINISMAMTFCDIGFIMVSFYDYFIWNEFSASLHYWCMWGKILLMNFRWLKFVFVKSYQVSAVWRDQLCNYLELWCTLMFYLIKPPNIYTYKDGRKLKFFSLLVLRIY